VSSDAGDGFEFEPSSYDDGAAELDLAAAHLDGATGESARIQGQAGAQLRQWLPTVPAADALDEVEGTADRALSEAAQVTHEDAGKLLAAKQNMLDTEARNTALINQIHSDIELPDVGRAPTLVSDDNGNLLPASRAGTSPGEDGRFSEPEGPQWQDVKDSAVNQANDMPRPPGIGDPKMAGALRMPDGRIYTGVSNQAINLDNYPQLKIVLDSVPPQSQSQYNWSCAEVHCITQALDDKYQLEDLAGAQSSAAQIRGPSSVGHGAWREPCAADKFLLSLLGIDW
jgi:hypothetical protein